MTRDEASLGLRVRTRVSCAGVPAGTEGVIDEQTEARVVVAWDLPDRPLPPGYNAFRPRSPLRYIAREDFQSDLELMYLDVVGQ